MTTPAIVPTDTEGLYPWDWAPEWAEFAVTDEDGDMLFFGLEPRIGDTGYWLAQIGSTWVINCGGLRLKPAHRSLDWRTTLRRRPQ